MGPLDVMSMSERRERIFKSEHAPIQVRRPKVRRQDQRRKPRRRVGEVVGLDGMCVRSEGEGGMWLRLGAEEQGVKQGRIDRIVPLSEANA